MSTTTDKGYKSKDTDLVDGFILKCFCKPLAPFFKATGHTPNVISLYGCILTLGSIYYIYKDDMLRFTVYFWTAYVLDCLDGYFARTYDMVTPFGDLFEHSRDVACLFLMMITCVAKYHITWYVAMIAIISSALTGIHVGCIQQRFSDRNYSETLDVFKGLCFNKTVGDLSLSYGVGMYMLTLYALVLYLSGGLFLFVKLAMIITIVLYFIGAYVDKNMIHYERVSIPSDIIPTPVSKDEGEARPL